MRPREFCSEILTDAPVHAPRRFAIAKDVSKHADVRDASPNSGQCERDRCDVHVVSGILSDVSIGNFKVAIIRLISSPNHKNEYEIAVRLRWTIREPPLPGVDEYKFQYLPRTNVNMNTSIKQIQITVPVLDACNCK